MTLFLVDVPEEYLPFILVDDAKVFDAQDFFVQFDTRKPFDEVVELYRNELQVQGWAVANENPIGNYIIITFTKAGEPFTVSIRFEPEPGGGGGTEVEFNLQK
jgi:hypothetical protein